MMASVDVVVDGSEAAASPSVSSHTDSGSSVSCVTSSIDVMTSVMASSSDDHASLGVSTPADMSCSASSSSGAQSPLSDSLTVTAPSQPVATSPTASSEQDITLTNTFGASMVTTIVTSAVSMGSVLSTSFSMTASSASVACMPMTQPTMVCSTQVTTLSPPVAISSSVPTMVSCTQDPKTNAIVLRAEVPVAVQQAPSQSVPVTVLGPHLSGVAHQVIRMKQGDRASLQTLPRIVPMNNGVHTDQLPQAVNQVSPQLGAVEALTNTAISDQFESRKPQTVAYTVHPCATIHEEHATVGQLHANVIHVPLVQSIGNCVSKTVHPVDNQPTKLVMASLQHVAHVISQNDLHQEDAATTKTDDACHNPAAKTVSSVDPHSVVGAQPGILQLDQTQCPGKCMEATSENRCSKDKHPNEPERADSKPSRGISIMKPLYDRESEIEEELQFVPPESTEDSAAQKVVKSDAPAVEEVHTVTNQLHSNQLSNIILPKSKSPFTIAQILEEADKQRRNQAQLKQKALLATQTDCHKPDAPGINDSLNISQLGIKTVFQVSGITTPVKSTKSGFTVGGTPVPVKSLVPNLEFGKNAGSHLASFVQKSLQTPVLFNSAPHPITSPRFPLNLTESVKKVMNAIPRTDTTPPPSPVYNKGPVSLTAPPSPPRHRAKSTSPIAHSAGLFPLPVHKRNNNDNQPLESSTSVKFISVAEKNPVFDDQAVLSQGTVTSDTTKTEKCAELVQKPLDDGSSEKCSPPDVRSAAPVAASVSSTEAKPKTETLDQTPVTRKYEGSGDDSFSSEHSYSAKPPGNMERPINDVAAAVSLQDAFSLDEENHVLPETSTCDLEKGNSVISLSVSAPIELTVVADEQVPLDEAPTKVSGCAGSVVLSPVGASLTSAEGLNKVLPIGRSDGVSGGKIHMISPVLPIASSRDDREGAGQTLVIKIVGAHAAPAKDSPAGNRKSDAKLSPSLSPTVSKESITTDMSVITVSPKPPCADGPLTDETKVCMKPKNCNSEFVDSNVNHEQKSLRAETDSESVRSLSPFTDDLGTFYHKGRSPSIDALSETSSTDGHSIHSNRTDNTDKLDSPASRPIRMATRNHGRRRNSPSDSSSDTPVKDDRGDGSVAVGTPKPSVVTRGSKRRLHSNHDDDSGVQDKKKRLDPELTDVSKQADSKSDDICSSDVKAKGNSARAATAKNKANSSHDPMVGHEEKQKGRKVTAKVNDVGKDESNATKRGQKTKPLADVKDEAVHQGKLDQKDEVVDTKGKRTTRSSRTKDHCELPNAAQLKRRRTSRDHR